MIDFAAAPFTARFTEGLPSSAYAFVRPTPVAKPRLLAWTRDLAADFGLAEPEPDGAAVRALGGSFVPPSSKPYAARYGGHQFGHWADQLGDGRAIGFGELGDRHGRPWEIQLKGAGRTPFSRGADGRAVLRSSVREFICGEAMHHLGVPTTRALSLVLTGDQVVRDAFYDGHPAPEPGAIVARASRSFVRIGNFEMCAADGDLDSLRRLLDFVITTQFTELGPPDRAAYVAFYREVVRRTAHLMVHWMSHGFVHGVMNTDNMSVLGLTIDYGPYGWLENYDPHWTPNTTDLPGRRYCFGRQPAVAEWNLAQLGSAIATLDEALVPDLRDALKSFGPEYRAASEVKFAAKLGWTDVTSPERRAHFAELDGIMRATEVDFTLFYRTLAHDDVDGAGLAQVGYREPSPTISARWDAWLVGYRALVADPDPVARRRAMDAVNALYVPRNYLLQEAIDLATDGDSSRLHDLIEAFRTPYAEQAGRAHFAGLRPEWARAKPGCSTLSCSS